MTMSMEQPVSKDGGRHCGARRGKTGGQCRKPAGWGTGHPGYGRCRLHGGMTPTHIGAAAREQAIALMRADVITIEADPTDLATYTYQRAGTLAGFYLSMMASCDVASANWEKWRRLEREARADLRVAWDAALRAGVAERRLRIAERQGQQIASALDLAAEDVGVEAEQRAQLIERFVARLQLLERSGDDIEGDVV
jgi:hypothetical protein